jgi:methylated-DNA-protein-cysteine methyltransferase-like protein
LQIKDCIVLTMYTHRSQPSGARNQAAAIEAEGVTVTTGALGELMVDFGQFGWFPRILPSEEAQGMVPDEDDDGDEEGDED